MERYLRPLVTASRWVATGAWSFFWMSAAILYRVFFDDEDRALSWARKYWGAGLVRIGGCQLEVTPGFVPQPGQPYIFVMNHQSMFDIVAAFVTVPVNIRFIAKKALRGIPFLGWYMRATGMIFIDRRDHEQAVRSLEEACARIRGGSSILVYPEGTRARIGGPILPFKKGPFVMAIQAGVPIVPVAIEGSGRLLPADRLTIQPGPVRILLGQPIPTAGLTEDDRDGLTRRVRDAIVDLHLQIGGLGGDKSQAIASQGVEGFNAREAQRARIGGPLGASR